MRLMLTAMLIAIASPGLAQRPEVSDPSAPAAIVPPITQPPSATIMAEPVAVFLAATDTDGDGRVTRAEARLGVARSFSTVETRTAGSIGYIGMADWAERWLGDRNALPSAYETDTDGDNRITLTELTAQIDKTFTRFDRNKDEVLVRSELLTLDSARRNNDRPDPRNRRGLPPQ